MILKTTLPETLRDATDKELVILSLETQKQFFADDSIIRKMQKKYYEYSMGVAMFLVELRSYILSEMTSRFENNLNNQK